MISLTRGPSIGAAYKGNTNIAEVRKLGYFKKDWLDNSSSFATLNSSSTIFRLNVTPSLPWLSLRKLFMLIKLVHFLLADTDAVWDDAESQTDECHNSRATKQYYPQFPNVIVVHIDIAPMWYVTYYCTCIFFSLYVKGCVYVVYNKLKIKSLNWIPVTIKFK